MLLSLQHQCLCRQSAAWKDSLRFRTPQMSQMPGLRRVTLNLNPDIGDRGAKELSEALRDDVCLKGEQLKAMFDVALGLALTVFRR